MLSGLNINLAFWLSGAAERRRPAAGGRAGAGGIAPPRPPRGHRRRHVRLARRGDPRRVRRRSSRARRCSSPRRSACSRDAEFELDDEGGESFLEALEQSLRQRRRNDAVRLDVESTASEEAVRQLEQLVEVVAGRRVPRGRAPRCPRARAAGRPARVRRAAVRRRSAGRARRVRPRAATLRACSSGEDVLLHHPYDSFEPVVAFVERRGRRSGRARHQADALPHQRRLADRRGADARRRCGQAGHGARRADGALRRDAEHPVGAPPRGNGRARHLRHPALQGAREDLPRRAPHAGGPPALRATSAPATTTTARRASTPTSACSRPTREIAADASAFWSALTGYSDPPRLRRLVMAPTTLRARLVALIEREQRRAEAGQPAAHPREDERARRRGDRAARCTARRRPACASS